MFKDGAEPNDEWFSSKSKLTQTMFSSNFPHHNVPKNLQGIYDALEDETTATRVIEQIGQKSEDMFFSY